MDPELLEKAILDRKEKTGTYPKAIIPVALYGMPYDCEKIMAIADKYDIPVIEDAPRHGVLSSTVRFSVPLDALASFHLMVIR